VSASGSVNERLIGMLIRKKTRAVFSREKLPDARVRKKSLEYNRIMAILLHI